MDNVAKVPRGDVDARVALELARLRKELRRADERDRRIAWMDRLVGSVSFALSWAGLLVAYVLVFEERGAPTRVIQLGALIVAVVAVVLAVLPLLLVRSEERARTLLLDEPQDPPE